MKKLFCSLVAVIIMALSWLFFGNSYRAKQYLLDTKLVEKDSTFELLYSSGFLRENIFIFSVSNDAVSQRSFHKLDATDPGQRIEIDRAQAALQKIISNENLYDNKEWYFAWGDGNLSTVILVHEPKRRSLLILRPF